MLQFLVGLQSGIHTTLSGDIAAFADTGDWLALLSVLPLGMLFGSIHALTPGHSKGVLAAYVIGSGLSWHSSYDRNGVGFCHSDVHAAHVMIGVGSGLAAANPMARKWTSKPAAKDTSFPKAPI